MAKLKSRTVAVTKLKIEEKMRMFAIFQKYYHNVSKEVFFQDLMNKDVVFLLIDSQNQKIQGFSTLADLKVKAQGKFYHAAFSGDTIIEKEYWGQSALGVAFLRYLFIQKLKRPWRPYYWFLISKGFKTYLLMANNFPTHYPRYEETTPAKEQAILDSLALKLYGESYQANRGLIVFAEDKLKDALKEDVAPITVDMLKNERISFFVRQNPQWIKGDELACLAQMTLTMPLLYQLKVVQKIWRKSFDGLSQKLAQALGLASYKGDK